MEFQLIAPPMDIAPWIAAGVQVAFDGAQKHPLATHFPALVEGGLTIVLEGELGVLSEQGELIALPQCCLSAAQSLPITLYRTARFRCIGLRLRAAGTTAILKASPSTLPYSLVSASDVWGMAWESWLQRILAATGDTARIATLFDFVRSQLRAEHHYARLQRALQLQTAALHLPGAGEAVGLTHRQFERVFSGTFGMRPKLFQRIARLEGVLREALATGRTDADIALKHGYFDQSHLGKDLRSLAGASLSQLVSAVRQHDTHYWPLAVGAAYRRAGVRSDLH